MKQTRRQFLKTTALATAAFGLAGTGIALAESVDLEELLIPGPLGDKILGDENAPVTIVEYASMTCGHCANFHKKTWPSLKEQYVDTGKVRFIFREYPLNQEAFAMSMLARCAPADKYFEIVDIMFEQLRSGALSGEFLPALTSLSKQIGYTQESFNKCLTDQGLLDALVAERDRASQKFGVKSTPTFFINGELHSGAMSIEQMGEIIEAAS
ncbi:thioredoxin domain-containing protein [Roseibium sediminicola]|uniref:Thioredoxin domain-containing protein n=1 Tax=Roseibium sediminicola TaxID=2933272 RepID=A0ABT0GMX7_9HYPH|nr:thioredoxin domain-containing protein [Roseibium sp. CAU 1639]